MLFILRLLFFCLPISCLAQAPSEKVPFRVIRNVRYAEKPGAPYLKDTSSDRMLDLYLPEITPSKSLPLIMFVHGGGFSGGDKYGTRVVCEHLAAYGFGVASVNYQLYLKWNKFSGASASANMAKGLPPNAKFHPALARAIEVAAGDARLALEWLIQNAKLYNIDTERIAVGGGSAGAMTALYLGYITENRPSQVKAVINLWGGVADTTAIKAPAPPLLTFHGTEDALINKDYAFALDQRMKNIKNTQSRLYIIEGKGHAIYNYIAKERTAEIVSFLHDVFVNSTNKATR